MGSLVLRPPRPGKTSEPADERSNNPPVYLQLLEHADNAIDINNRANSRT